MKKTFLAGLAILLPIAVTIFLIFFVVDFLTAPFVDIVEDTLTRHGAIELKETHKYLLLFVSRAIALVLLFFFIFLLGFLGRRLFFSWFIHLTHRIFEKIPIIKTIYRITKEVSDSFLSEKQKGLFQGTVAVPFPNEKTYALGLLAGKPPTKVSEKKENLVSVFIPTSPHPVSGFIVMYNKDEVKETPFGTEDLFKFLLSCGMHNPEKQDS